MLSRFLVGLMFVFLLVPFQVQAQATGLKGASTLLDSTVGKDSGTGLEGDLKTSVGTIVSGVLSILGTIFLLLMVYAGVLWMTAQGEESKVATAKKIITAAITGLFIVLSAYAITAFVTGKLSGSNNSSPSADQGGCCYADATHCMPTLKSGCAAQWNPGSCPGTDVCKP